MWIVFYRGNVYINQTIRDFPFGQLEIKSNRPTTAGISSLITRFEHEWEAQEVARRLRLRNVTSWIRKENSGNPYFCS